MGIMGVRKKIEIFFSRERLNRFGLKEYVMGFNATMLLKNNEITLSKNTGKKIPNIFLVFFCRVYRRCRAHDLHFFNYVILHRSF